MRWQVKLPIHAPIQILPHPQRHCPAILQLKVRFALTDTKGEHPSMALGPLLDDLGFELRWTEIWEQLPPRPWQPFLGSPNPAELKNACYVEAAMALRVLEPVEMRKKQPLSPGKVHHQLTLTKFPQNIREAFAFALFDFKMPLDQTPILETWQNDVHRVIYERKTLATPPSHLNSVLLQHGYQLLNLLSEQIQTQPSATELVKRWEEFNQQATIDLPLVFAIIYWDQAAHQLSEHDDQAGAQALLNKQEQVLTDLFVFLPHLTEKLNGGLRHHLGRTMYYHGELEQALQQYSLEWQLRQAKSSVKIRLQRSMARVLLDMGHFHYAQQLAQQTLDEQQRNNSAYLYKSLGHLGEIYLRQGNYAKALEYFSQAWQKQASTAKEGQTAISLGHAHLLNGDLTQAKEWYQQAERVHKKQHIHFNPFLIMGQIVVAKRQGEIGTVKKLWQMHKDKLENLENYKALPAAVAATAVFETDTESSDELLDGFIDKLIDGHYLIEVIYPLLKRFATPTLAATPLQRLTDGLTSWQQALDNLQGVVPEIKLEDTSPIPTPTLLLNALITVRQEDNWQALEAFLPAVYLMNLLNDG
jgi:tetratricopeptide (TPR) repeat protein